MPNLQKNIWLMNEFKNKIESILGVSEIDFFWKGRVALYALLKSCGVKDGDEVILPAFTCVVVPNAIKYLGAVPVYVDIERDSMCSSMDSIRSAVTDKTKAIICQNTFGLSYQLEEIVSFAKEKSITTIEDCTHGFGGFYKGRPNGTWCDASFFSTQWNKPFSTGVGGFSLINSKERFPQFSQIVEEFKSPSFKEKAVLWCLLFTKRFLLKDWNYWKLVQLYRWMSKMGLLVGSSKSIELTSTNMPSRYLMKMSGVQYRAGNVALEEFSRVNKRRKIYAKAYGELLKSWGKYYVPEKFENDHLFLKYPVLTECRDQLFVIAEKEEIPLGDWFLSPIHPVEEEFEKWNLDLSRYNNATYLSQRVINLPTDIEDVNKVLSFLERNKDLLV
jgi:dTDP-4-amino-4,6-dideoxygalactose transaminase